MDFDDLVKSAARDADQRPPLTPGERAPFAYLREEFQEAFRAVRAACPETARNQDEVRPEFRARIVLFLHTLRMELRDASLAFDSTGLQATARDPGIPGNLSAVPVLWSIEPGVEARLTCFRGQEHPGASGWLDVDLTRGFAHERPFEVGIVTVPGGTPVASLMCTDPGSTVSLPIHGPGDIEIAIGFAGKQLRIQVTVVDDRKDSE